MRFLQLELNWFGSRSSGHEHFLHFGDKQIPLIYRRNPLARRYRLFVDNAGRPCVTIPSRGSQREAERFVDQHRDWLVRQVARSEARRKLAQTWHPGGQVLFRGTPSSLELVAGEPPMALLLGSERIPLPAEVGFDQANLRVVVEKHLRCLAESELPARVIELAALHKCQVRAVTIRNQRSRWGSCSRRGTISLNWRLVQVPVEVRDYIILHELMHLREMNHSRRFWSHVEQVCPGYEQCEAWLRTHSPSLL